MQINESISGALTQTGASGQAGSSSTGNAELKKVAQQFEAIFMRQMISTMRSSSMGDGIFDSAATEQFRDMADARTADEMAKTGSFGIAELLMKQFAQRPSVQASAGSAAAASAADTTASDMAVTAATSGKGNMPS